MWKTVFKKFEGVWSALNRPYPFKFFKGCLWQILLRPFLEILSHLTQFRPRFYFHTHVFRGYNDNIDLKWVKECWPTRPNPGRREKIKLNFYFHTFSRCLKRFYEGLKVLHKPFEAPQRSVKIRIRLNFLNFYFNTTFRNV